MKIVQFPKLTSAIAKELVENPDFLDLIQAIGIKPESWSDGPAKRVATKYVIDRMSNGHEYAHWSAMQSSLDFDHLEEMRVELPSHNEKVLKLIYEKSYGIHRAEELARTILLNPSDAEDLIRKFQLGQSLGIEVASLYQHFQDYLPEREKKIQDGTLHVGLQNYPLISKMIGGFNPGRLGILLADTGFGKTNLGLRLALDAGRQMRTLYFNMEMSPYDFTERALVALSGAPYSDFNKASMDSLRALEPQLQRLFIDVTGGKDLSLDQIRSLCRQKHKQAPNGFIVIDYDQKLVLEETRDVKEWKALQNAMVALDSLSKELNAFILVLAQTNEDGAISGSRRSTFPASTVLKFFMDENGDTPVVQAVKNRFGKRNDAVSVIYEPERAMIKEISKTIVTQKPKRNFV